MSIAAIAIICTVVGSLLGAGALVARAVRAWAAEVAALRQEIAALRLEMERARREDQLKMRDLVAGAIKEHASDCPGIAFLSVHQAHRRS